MKNGFAVILLASVLVSLSLLAAPPVSELNTKMQFPEPLPIERTSHNVHNTFFSKLQLLCGKTFSGQLVADTSQSERFAGQKLLSMYVLVMKTRFIFHFTSVRIIHARG